MKSKVFISCGQQPHEKAVAEKIGRLLEYRGFEPYIAINALTIPEINAGIIGELKDSDCYLFVNFRCEQIKRKAGGQYRGSLFSNQELAVAYALGFNDHILVINQRGVLREGMLAYIAVNTETFENYDDCCAVVERELDRSRWTPEYSRRLSAEGLRFSEYPIGYGNFAGYFLNVDIRNHRPDIAAMVTTAKCIEFAREGETPQACRIRSPLKATGFPGFSHTIFPQSHEAFDLLCVGKYGSEEQGVFLNTALDEIRAPRLSITQGVWKLRYDFFAIDFPLLSVLVELNLTDWNRHSARIIDQKTI
jgi:hypothetical protein